MLLEDQVIRYAELNGRSLAWSSVGSGPALVVGGWWSASLERDWQIPAFRRFVQALGEHRTVVRYDRMGTGQSDPHGPVSSTLESEVATLGRVVDVAAQGQVDVLGASSGGPVAAAYAAQSPDRVRRVAMYGSYADGSTIASPAARDTILDIVSKHWGIGSRVLADMFLPDSTGEERARFAQFQRDSASKDVALASLRAVFEFDARPQLGDIRSPVVVLHRKHDRAIPFALGRELASLVPHSTFVELEGTNHFPWLGDTEAVSRTILEFLGATVPAGAKRQPATGSLSERERDVLRLVAKGLTDQQIAAELVLSVHTVHRHVANARMRLEVTSRAAAAARATERGLI